MALMFWSEFKSAAATWHNI